jgi:LDH2 family malate/lactate/ureidoglycolate dehydrogenase
MRKLLLQSSLVVLLVVLIDPAHAACWKKKRKKKKAETEALSKTTPSDSLRIVRAPGVPNRAEYDSIKAAKDKLKREELDKKK